MVSRLSTHGLESTFVAVCSFFIFIMSATVCCLFFWWQRKTNFNKHEQTKNSFTAKPRFKITSKIPVIRSEDIVSFVLPATHKVLPHTDRRMKLQKNPASVESQSSFTKESQPLNNVVTRFGFETSSATDTVCPHRVNSKLLDPANLNLKLYSRDLETNELVYTSQAKIGFSLQFNSSRQLLTLKILGALNLPTRSKNIAPDPYVKIVILPERQIKCITKTLKSNCNPLFNQVFELDMSGSPLNKTDILLMVRDRPETSCYERCVSRSVSLGQAIFSMADFNGVNHRRQVRWCLLENTQAISPHADIVNAESVPKAEMQISLLYRVWSDETKLINHGRIILELLQIRPTSFIPNNQDKEKGEK